MLSPAHDAAVGPYAQSVTTEERDEFLRPTTAEWEAVYAGDVPESPVDSDLVSLASSLQPGTALDLGCGAGQNSIWLAQRGWRVHGIDIASGAIERAQLAAAGAGVEATFETADVTTWRTRERFDLVISTYALPPRGTGRDHALVTARDAVAPGGTALVAEFDVSLAASSPMTEENLVSLDEITSVFEAFDLERAEVHVAGHGHGAGDRQLAIVIVIAHLPEPRLIPPPR